MAADDSLYERLGGRDAVDAVVDEFYDRVLADEELEPYFEGVDDEELRDHQKEFISHVTGGTDGYDGQSIQAAHAPLDVTAGAFDRVAGHLDDSLRACDVAESDREELLTAVASLEEDVVTA